MRILLTVSLIALMSAYAVVAAESSQKYALLIAVTEYEDEEMNSSELLFPEADAKSLGELLSYGGYKVEFLLGGNATQLAIREKLDELARQGSADGVVVVGMFGHGVEVETQDANGVATTEGCFCPFDTTMHLCVNGKGRIVLGDGEPVTEPDPQSLVKFSELMQAFQKANAEKRVAFLDCSHLVSNQGRTRTFGSSAKATDLPPNTAILFAGSPNEQTYENKDWRHGAFTKCLLQDMQDLYALGFVTTGPLALRVRTSVPRLVAGPSDGKRQTPRLIGTGSIDLQFPKLTTRRVFVGKSGGEGKELVPGMMFRWCPMGNAAMGSPNGEIGRNRNEDQVEVSLSGFWLGETEVTQRQWQVVMNTAPWKGKAKLHTGRLEVAMVVKEGDGYAASYVSHGDRGDGTIEPDSATEFCHRLTQRERNAGRLPIGWKFALPTEAQWEYACRAGSNTRFCFGDEDTQLGDHAWWGAKYGNGTALGNAWKDHYPNLVGVKKPNAWGLHDMHGNVWEWCADWFGDRLPGGRDPVGVSQGSIRVCRGGSWVLAPSNCRSATRGGGSSDNRNSTVGFRVAAVPSKD